MRETSAVRDLDPFLNYFRRQAKPDEELYELSYLSAYEILPTAVQKDAEGFWKDYYLARYPALAWYAHLCLLTQRSMNPFSAVTFQWHKGRLSNGREYMVLQYPQPEAFDLGREEFDRGERSDPCERLYPYFSAVLRTTTSKPARCISLGQSPVDGISSLRLCRAAAHYKIGEGPEPKLQAFLDSLLGIDDAPIISATIRFPKHLDAEDEELMKSFAEGDHED